MLRWSLSNWHDTIWYDQALYCKIAENIQLGHWDYKFLNDANYYCLQDSGLSVYNPPLYPLTMALAAVFVGDIVFAGTLISLLLHAVMLFAIYAICRELMGWRWALGVIGVLVLSEHMISISVSKFAESSFLGYLYSAVYCGLLCVKGPRLRWALAALSGLLLGCAYLTKPEAIVVVPAFLLAFLWSGVRRTGRRLTALKGVLWFLLGFLVVVSPYIAYVQLEAGSNAVPSKLGYNLIVSERRDTMHFSKAYFELNEDCSDTVVSQRTMQESEFDNFVASMPALPERAFQNLKSCFRQLLGSQSLAFVFLFLCGAVLGLRDRSPTGRWAYLALALFCFLQLLPYTLTTPLTTRAVRSVFPILIILAFYGLAQVVDGICAKLGISKEKLSAALVVLVLAFFAFMTPGAMKSLSDTPNMHVYARGVGEWLRTNTDPDTVVMCRNPAVMFHAQRGQVIKPEGNVFCLHKYAKRKGATILVHREPALFDSNNGRQKGGVTRKLDRYPSRFRRLHTYKDDFWTVVVYRIIYSSP